MLKIIWINCVENVKEVLSGRPFADRKLIGEVLSELRVFIKLRPQVLDRQLVVMGHRDLLHLGLLQEILITAQDILEEVLVDHILIRQVVLH